MQQNAVCQLSPEKTPGNLENQESRGHGNKTQACQHFADLSPDACNTNQRGARSRQLVVPELDDSDLSCQSYQTEEWSEAAGNASCSALTLVVDELSSLSDVGLKGPEANAIHRKDGFTAASTFEKEIHHRAESSKRTEQAAAVEQDCAKRFCKKEKQHLLVPERLEDRPHRKPGTTGKSGLILPDGTVLGETKSPSELRRSASSNQLPNIQHSDLRRKADASGRREGQCLTARGLPVETPNGMKVLPQETSRLELSESATLLSCTGFELSASSSSFFSKTTPPNQAQSDLNATLVSDWIVDDSADEDEGASRRFPSSHSPTTSKSNSGDGPVQIRSMENGVHRGERFHLPIPDDDENDDDCGVDGSQKDGSSYCAPATVGGGPAAVPELSTPQSLAECVQTPRSEASILHVEQRHLSDESSESDSDDTDNASDIATQVQSALTC